jgi:hypothetical protein
MKLFLYAENPGFISELIVSKIAFMNFYYFFTVLSLIHRVVINSLFPTVGIGRTVEYVKTPLMTRALVTRMPGRCNATSGRDRLYSVFSRAERLLNLSLNS